MIICKYVNTDTYKYDLIWEYDLCKYNQVKMRSSELALIKHNQCTYKKRQIPREDRDTQGEGHVMRLNLE